jgi:hypothetical protein
MSIRSILLDTDGHYHFRSTGHWCWQTWGDVPRTTAQLATGRPLLVIYDPSDHEFLLDLLVDAVGWLDPSGGGNEDDLEVMVRDYLPAGSPGASLLDEVRRIVEDRGSETTPQEMQALAAVDFLNCWSKRYSVST